MVSNCLAPLKIIDINLYPGHYIARSESVDTLAHSSGLSVPTLAVYCVIIGRVSEFNSGGASPRGLSPRLASIYYVSIGVS